MAGATVLAGVELHAALATTHAIDTGCLTAERLDHLGVNGIVLARRGVITGRRERNHAEQREENEVEVNSAHTGLLLAASCEARPRRSPLS